MISTQCAILVGGMGTRLGDLTRDMPKPLLPVGGKPFVDLLVGEAVRRGFRNIVLLAGYKAEQVRKYTDGLASRLPAGCTVSVSIEPEALGTGGALRHAAGLLDDRFLLVNGDTWFDFNWLDLAIAADHCSALAARLLPEADRYEAINVQPGGEVTAIIPRRLAKGQVLVNGGVYYLCKSDLHLFPDKFSIENDLLPELIRRRRLRARAYEGFFLDIGIPSTFQAAQTQIAAQRTRRAIFFDRDGVLNKDHGYVGSRDRFEWVDGAKEAVRLANDLGYYVFVVTNQAGVARGLYSEDDVASLHDWMADELRRAGASVDDWRYCPFHPDGTIERYRAVHAWRKPDAGMLLDLMSHWPVDRNGSMLIGDKESDCVAAEKAGIEGHLFRGGNLFDFTRSLIAAEVTA